MESCKLIKPHKYCHDPEIVWEIINHTLDKKEIKTLDLKTPIYENKVRFVCISDTHSKAEFLQQKIPRADVLLHAGDFTSISGFDEIKRFNDFMATLNDRVKYKVVIAGNHDLLFQDLESQNEMSDYFKDVVRKQKAKNNRDVRDLLTNCIYLEDSSITLYGIKIYGSPWQPWFGGWAFNLERGEKILEKWNKIPKDTDVLLTHAPPLGFGDKIKQGLHVGCSELLFTVKQRVKPKFHVFGHIHEDYGSWTDETTTYINASTCDLKYQPIHDPILFDIEFPSGFIRN